MGQRARAAMRWSILSASLDGARWCALCLLARQKPFESKRCSGEKMPNLSLLALALAAPSLLSARSKTEQNATTIDSGTFSILVGGRKVGAETFAIKQSPTSALPPLRSRSMTAAARRGRPASCALAPKASYNIMNGTSSAPRKVKL